MIFVGKGKRPFGRSNQRWKNCSKIEVEEVEWKVVDWIHLAQDRDQ
jgi:hypothetical protein